jgi:hypothetical protein
MAVTSHTLPDEEDFARMEASLFTRLERSHTRQVRRHRLVAAASVVLLAGAGIASATQANGVVVSNAAYCYASDSSSARTVQVEAPDVHFLKGGTIPGAKSRVHAAAVALDQCGALWDGGFFAPPGPASGQVITIPQLQACVRNDLVIAVLPKYSAESADGFCTDVGMNAP